MAFRKRDQEKIAEIKNLIIERGISDHQPALCDVLTYQLEEEYSQAAKLAEKHAIYFAVASQGAFCWLVEGERDKASNILERTRFQANTANWWLQGIIAASYGAWEVYGEAMCLASGRKLSQPEATTSDLWVEYGKSPRVGSAFSRHSIFLAYLPPSPDCQSISKFRGMACPLHSYIQIIASPSMRPTSLRLKTGRRQMVQVTRRGIKCQSRAIHTTSSAARWCG